MTDDRSTALLVVRCQLGEPSALAELVRAWHPPLWTYLRRMSTPQTADDLAQEAWLAVLKGLPRLREPARFAPWFFTIARRTLLDRLRERYRPEPVLPEAVSPSAEVVLDVLAIRAGLAEVPLVEREVLALFHLADLSLRDCAAVLGVPEARSSPGCPAPAACSASACWRRGSAMSERFDEPSLSAAEVLARLAPERRLRHVLVGLAGLSGALLTGALWLTEPALPAVTRLAFGVLTAIGLSWAAFAVWALTRRGPLLARDSVVAGWLALGFASVTAAGLAVVTASRGGLPVALALGGTLVALAAVGLTRALRRRRELTLLRQRLDTA
ncbi:sigma-70 family RNA polymerase sigma factor [Crossiella sp. SN42]|uniref:RNA polymerase sigma factor n=1 Tax=Crossiella sp. SN42 TaxID=2944808 RepID=UPI00207C28E8|nr:sigma-70 family RNA polymerase sigma factor [Crossiella sp. SN42]MCO1577733.1 sigma-70 family RNA polymerase sigma factor [Crossiella sp. SN42]